jgi:hypothetical protein
LTGDLIERLEGFIEPVQAGTTLLDLGLSDHVASPR